MPLIKVLGRPALLIGDEAALNAEESPIMRQVFSVLFPFGPALNSILGTFYISSCVFPYPGYNDCY